jgi:hypothetical protein
VHKTNGTVDSLFTGKRLQGFDTLDTERDRFSHTFNAESNDIGLPGDLIDTLVGFRQRERSSDGTTFRCAAVP